MEGLLKGLSILLAVLFVGIGIFSFTPYGRGVINTYEYNVQKVDDITDYETIKK